MQTKRQIQLARKAIYLIMALGMFLSTFSGQSLLSAHAQTIKVGSPTPIGTETSNKLSIESEKEDVDQNYVPNQLIIKFKSIVTVNRDLTTTNSSEVNDLMAQAGVTSVVPMIKWPNGEKPTDFPEIDSYYVINLSPETNIKDAQKLLGQSDDIEFTFPNYIINIVKAVSEVSSQNNSTSASFPYTLSGDPNDFYYNNSNNPQWTLHDDHLKFRSAWNIATGSSDVVVAVLDTGLDITHSDIGGKNTGTGRNMVEKNSHGIYYDPSNITDDQGHGTLVAGLIAAYSNNSSGITGMCWDCKIMPVKVCNDVGNCTTLDVIDGMLWAANHGAKVINMSLSRNILDSGYSDPATHIQQFFDYVYNKGVVVIASAGNNNENLVVPTDNNSSSIIFPAAFNHVIAVGAVNRYDQRCNFSVSICGWDQIHMTASGWGERLDVVAPGSTDYPSTDILGSGGYNLNGDYYMNMGGTSGAAPHVAGLAALILSVDPSLNPDEVENIIEQNAVDLGISGKDIDFGWGRINAYAAIIAASTTGDTVPPTGLWVSPGNGQTISSRSVAINVNASDNSGGSGVREVRFSAMWGGVWRSIGNVSSSPYSLNWDMCSYGVSDGDIELGFEVWDNANNKWVYSDYYNNIHINKNYACTQGADTTPPTGSWTSPNNGQTISSQNVTLSVNASDNSGGSGVREVRWSAKWNNTWYGVGSDTTAPYSVNWDMCAVGVPNGDVELGMEVWDNANNKWVYSEHYTNYHINKSYTCSGTGTGSWETWGWQNKYLAGYDNWHGTVTWENYPYIWWDFGTGGPFGWGGNEFSLRMQRDVYFQGGDYSFHADHDDGVRVYLDGQLIIDAWWDGNGGHDAGKYVSQGNHQVKVEFYENQGDALVHVLWYGPGYPRPDNNPPDGGITSPSNHSATASSPLTITANASDDASGVNRVEFYVWYCDASCNWRSIGTDYDSPYSTSWDWSALADQHVYLTTHIVDNTGKVREDPGGYVEIDLDRTVPVASITSPLEGAALNGSPFTISVDAGDSLSGVGTVQFFVGYAEAGIPRTNNADILPAPAIFDVNRKLATARSPQAADYWHEIGWDSNGSDGWSINWDPASVLDQNGISVFAYVYDNAWNYQGAIQGNISLYRPPLNDDINTPVQFDIIPFNGLQKTVNATVAGDDPTMTVCGRGTGDATIWYRYLAPANAHLHIDTIGSDYDTVVAVWDGVPGNLNPVGCNDDNDTSLQSELTIDVIANTTYYIEIAQYVYEASGPTVKLQDEKQSLLNRPSDIGIYAGGSLHINVSYGPIFTDVPLNYWANTFIERLYNNGITGGCSASPLMYCPNSTVTRAQMAVFLLVAEHGTGYTPPSATGLFNDVPANNGFAKWIEQLYNEGITGGCGGANYCPNAPVTREQMAVFLLVAKYGSGYAPPAATGVFADVPASYPFAPWIEALAAEGITGGCGGGNYCPKKTVTRAQMAVFLVAAFNLP